MNNTSAWTWAAALSLLLAVLPSTAAQAGWGGWVAPLLVLPFIWLSERLLRPLYKSGLAAVFCRVLGNGFGRLLTIIYMVWATVLDGTMLRGGLRRVEMSVSVGGRPWLLAVVLVLLAVWFVRGRTVFCARWAVLVFGGLLAMLIGLAGLALLQVQWDNLLPLRLDWSGILNGTAVAFGVLCVRVYGGFLHEEDVHGRAWHPMAVCGLMALLLLEVQGALGVELAARLEDPLLALSRNVGVEGTFQRVESLVSAGLLSADLALLTLLIWAARRSGEQLWGAHNGPKAALGTAVGVLVCALWPMEETVVRLFRQQGVPAINFALGFVIPLLLVIIDSRKQRKTGAHLVLGKEENGTY